MKTHRFNVIVPNPTAKAEAIELRIEIAQASDWADYSPKKGKSSIKIVGAGISPDPCAEEGKERIKLKLEPFSDMQVHVVVQTKGTGVTGLNLIDKRHSKDVGGVLLLCADPALVDLPGTIVPARKPCPAVLARDLYAIAADEDPATAAAITPVIGGVAFDLVAAITNPTRSPLVGATAYLEHCGQGGASFGAGHWNMGDLASGDVFFATWRVDSSPSIAPVVVVSSDGFDPVRFAGKLKLKPAKDRARVPG